MPKYYPQRNKKMRFETTIPEKTGMGFKLVPENGCYYDSSIGGVYYPVIEGKFGAGRGVMADAKQIKRIAALWS